MKKSIAVTAWWVSLLFTSLAVITFLLKSIFTRTLPASSVWTLGYGIITILALLLNRNDISIKSKSTSVLEQLMLAAAPLLYGVALMNQTRFRPKPDLLPKPELLP